MQRQESLPRVDVVGCVEWPPQCAVCSVQCWKQKKKSVCSCMRVTRADEQEHEAGAACSKESRRHAAAWCVVRRAWSMVCSRRPLSLLQIWLMGIAPAHCGNRGAWCGALPKTHGRALFQVVISTRNRVVSCRLVSCLPSTRLSLILLAYSATCSSCQTPRHPTACQATCISMGLHRTSQQLTPHDPPWQRPFVQAPQRPRPRTAPIRPRMRHSRSYQHPSSSSDACSPMTS